jgi:hypothetical protein
MSETTDDLALLTKLRTWFDNSEDATADARREAEKCRDYYDGKQLTEEERATLRARGQPEMVANRIKPKVNYLKGVEKKARMDPKAYPRNPGDEDDAQAATDSIRYVCDAETFDKTASRTWDNMLIEGFGGCDVVVEDAKDGPCVRVIHFRWDRLFFDPHSAEPDFTDAKFLGGVLWMDEDEVRANPAWQESEEAISGAYAYASSVSGTTYDDKPKGAVWADYKRKRLRVIQIHWIEGGVWWLATLTAGGFLVKPEKSPYKDDKGQPECSLVLQSAYVDRDNNRYGAVADMVGPQDEINKRRSKALHLLTMRQVVAERGAFDNVDEARAEFAKPDGFVEKNPGFEYKIEATNDLAAGQFQLLQEAKQELDAAGPNASMQGRQGGSASGRAIALSQQGGAIEVDGALLDLHRDWKRRVYRAIWNRVRQFWTEEKWIRVTENVRNVRFVGLNRPMTYADAMERLPPEQQAMAAQQLGLQPGDPRLAQPVIGQDGQPVIMNQVGALDVDIVVDESPDVATLQIEQFQQLGDILTKVPQLIPATLDLLIEASSLRNKDALLERVKALQNPAPQQQGPSPEMMQVQQQAEAQQAEFGLKQQAQQQDFALAVRKQQGEMAIKAWSAQQQVGLRRQQQAMQALTALRQPAPMAGPPAIN